ncbi:MAG: three-Cys-motif partner protein TcmP [Leptospiraceae bacterium]|nr:three-Cys-motif partner protein TcmP [Leptospiraceae bacterium]
MESRSFTWKGWEKGSITELKEHSKAKLDILRDYIQDYLEIIIGHSTGGSETTFYFIDGFAGGGQYDGGELGSPFVFLQAIKETEFKLNQNRNKKIKIKYKLFCIEKDKNHFDALNFTFESSEYKSELQKNVFLCKGTFTNNIPSIIQIIKKNHPRGGGNTFLFLDQCGYAKVPVDILKGISVDLNNKVEFLINFNVYSFITYMEDGKLTNKRIENLGLENYVDPKVITHNKMNEGKFWRHNVEKIIGNALKSAIGLDYFSPFYIFTTKHNQQGYWLIHIACHERARSAMMDVYWKYGTNMRHFGSNGLNIFERRYSDNESNYIEGLDFVETNKIDTIEKIKEDLIHNKFAKGVFKPRSVQDLYSEICNNTIANREILGKALQGLYEERFIEITGKSGGRKRSNQVKPEHIIHINQPSLFEYKDFYNH